MWNRKRTVIGGRIAEGDFTVYRHKQAVGRVGLAPSMPDTQPYQWSTNTYPCDRGRADSLEEALHLLREAIRAHWPDDVPEVPRSGTKFSSDLP